MRILATITITTFVLHMHELNLVNSTLVPIILQSQYFKSGIIVVVVVVD